MKKNIKNYVTLFCSFIFLIIPLIYFSPFSLLKAQSTDLALFTVHSGDITRMNLPVSASLAGVPLHYRSGSLQLFEIVNGNEERPTASQVDGGFDLTLRWILSGETAPGETRQFILKSIPENEQQEENKDGNIVQIEDDGKSLLLKISEKNILNYRYAKKDAPDDAPEVYGRGGYIHPLWSPSGEILTRIQPPDHYHHYGIWNPWTKTEFEGKEVDFWNLIKEQGTVRPESIPVKVSGEVYGEFEAIHNHVDLNASTPSGEKIALKEKWNVKVWNANSQKNVWLIDFTSVMNPASESPLVIKAFRYQGFSIRASEKWNDETADLLTSE